MEKIGSKGKTQCHGIVPETGEQCKRTTFDSSSYCQLHREQFSAESEFGILRCAQCIVRDCQERDKAPRGMCFFELYDETRAFDSRDKTLKAMREVLRTEYTMKNRLERELSRVNLEMVGSGENGGDRIAQLFHMYQTICNSIASHLERFGKFQGYEASEALDETTKKKMAAVDRALNASRKKREAKETEEKAVTIEVTQ